MYILKLPPPLLLLLLLGVLCCQATPWVAHWPHWLPLTLLPTTPS
jgi:hypothetical protein